MRGSEFLKRAASRRRIMKRVRAKVWGTPLKPRLSVSCTLKHVYAQIIDDLHGRTLASASTRSKSLRSLPKTSNVEAAQAVGRLIAQEARRNGIIEVAFSRGWRQYHGKVKKLAEVARQEGLKF